MLVPGEQQLLSLVCGDIQFSLCVTLRQKLHNAPTVYLSTLLVL